jgi:hypothetical protein
MTSAVQKVSSARPLASPGRRVGLTVERTDITFANLTADRVAVAIRVRNEGVEESLPTVARIQAAPLGAFVPWRPLALVKVPRLRPGESFPLRLEASPAPLPTLGDPNRVRPRDLLTALAQEDPSGDAAGSGRLPADPMALLRAQRNPHWAGNLNIFVTGRAVERHLARALRIYPGRLNLAMFVVGSGPDAYQFALRGEGAAWATGLQDMSAAPSLDPARGRAIPLNEWVEVPAMRLMVLGMQPPADCRSGAVEVGVQQRSTGKEAVVEFSLDPQAAGPGCYVV